MTSKEKAYVFRFPDYCQGQGEDEYADVRATSEDEARTKVVATWTGYLLGDPADLTLVAVVDLNDQPKAPSGMLAYTCRLPDYVQTGNDDEDYVTVVASNEDAARRSAAAARNNGMHLEIEDHNDIAIVSAVPVGYSTPPAPTNRVAIWTEGGVVQDVVMAGGCEYQVVDCEDVIDAGEDTEAAWAEACRWAGAGIDESTSEA